MPAVESQRHLQETEALVLASRLTSPFLQWKSQLNGNTRRWLSGVSH